jgi:hypothetical protein
MMWGIRVSGFTVRWKIPVTPLSSYYLGGVLRGILGHALFSQVCIHPVAQCQNCLLAPQCQYQTFFKPNNDNTLAAYVLHDWKIEHDEIAVTILVLNSATSAVESWIRGLQAQLPKLEWFGRKGMKLNTVQDWQSGDFIYRHGRFMKKARLYPLEYLPPIGNTARIQFITPLISKHQHDDPLIAPLRTRLQRLRNQFGDGGVFSLTDYWQSDILKKKKIAFELGNKKRPVQGDYYDLVLRDISDDAQLLLSVGTFLHAGGQTSFGLGRYHIVG